MSFDYYLKVPSLEIDLPILRGQVQPGYSSGGSHKGWIWLQSLWWYTKGSDESRNVFLSGILNQRRLFCSTDQRYTPVTLRAAALHKPESLGEAILDAADIDHCNALAFRFQLTDLQVNHHYSGDEDETIADFQFTLSFSRISSVRLREVDAKC